MKNINQTLISNPINIFHIIKARKNLPAGDTGYSAMSFPKSRFSLKTDVIDFLNSFRGKTVKTESDRLTV
jgi:hypothetical protein